MPPDAFRLERGDFSSITLTLPAGELVLRRGPGGVLGEFPAFLAGAFFPVLTRFDAAGGITGFSLGAETPWEIAFLQTAGPILARVSAGTAGGEAGLSAGDSAAGFTEGSAAAPAEAPGEGEFYFVVIDQPGFLRSVETWFDREGAVLAVFTGIFRFLGDGFRRISRIQRSGAGETGEYVDYDSGGNISALSLSGNRFSALYSPGNYPRYREIVFPQGTETYSIQWDEQNRAVRMTRSRSGGDPGEDEALDFRYEYAADSRGNWIERREIPLLRRFDFLVPAPETVITRRIEYAPGEAAPALSGGSP
jgi:hypothetical protein